MPLSVKDTDVLTAVFKNLAVGVVVCDTGGNFLFFSPEAERSSPSARPSR
jgi:hypothetical protein